MQGLYYELVCIHRVMDSFDEAGRDQTCRLRAGAAESLLNVQRTVFLLFVWPASGLDCNAAIWLAQQLRESFA